MTWSEYAESPIGIATSTAVVAKTILLMRARDILLSTT
jgi:hypothetical protein